MNKTNPELISLIINLKKKSREENVNIWRDIAERLERPLRVWPEVNVSRIERYAENSDIILVPGKVLGSGIIKKKVTVSAFRFSKEAKEKIESAGGKVLTIEELMAINPKGKGVKIIG
ncbi:MAG: 50S ribosomal protein L18e [Thermoplasmata archaeon]|jgi:large subunit ribosomal protein L18e|nr:50S ribosomal protein L18e [Euryarchaeota archaeon]MVT14687.1 50S ribosomal protein L18e [Euryarchaeota archaeon]MVT35927.1 50S ribosomal protein L18e [Euryarchaeota archaeon]